MSTVGPTPSELCGSLKTWFERDYVTTHDYNLLLITYGQPGDDEARQSLLEFKEGKDNVNLSVVPAKDLTPELHQWHHENCYYVIVNHAHSCYVGAATLYNDQGLCIGARGGPGNTGRGMYVDKPRIIYQVFGSDIIINPYNVATKSLADAKAIGAYFDRPQKINIVYGRKVIPDIHEYKKLVEEGFDGEVKIMSYVEALIDYQKNAYNKRVRYISLEQHENYHELMYHALHKERVEDLMRDLSRYEHISLSMFAQLVHNEEMSDMHKRLINCCNGGVFDKELGQGGFRRDEQSIISATTSPSKSILNEVGIFDNIRTGAFVDEFPVEQPISGLLKLKGRRVGPITMPGLGERKKKGKNRSRK